MKYFLTSVADVWLYDENDNLVGTSKTLMDSSLELTLSNTDVRGGKGNALQYILYQGADLNVTLTDTQFNLDFLAKTSGQNLATGANVYAEEDVTLGAAGAGTVTGTPIVIQGSTIYGWVTHSDGYVERVTFTGQNFTSAYGAENDVVCVRYFNTNAAAKELTINANIVPSIVRCVMDAQLASSDDSANIIGKVEFVINRLTLSGNFALSMTADGVATTPLTGRALSYTPTSGSCANQAVYGTITRVVDSANWYDDVEALAIVNGDLALTDPATEQLLVKAVHTDGSVSTPPVADLTFASDDAGVATVDSAGLVTTVAAGTTYISVTITAKPAVDAAVECVVS